MNDTEKRLKALENERMRQKDVVYIISLNRDGTATATINGKELTFQSKTKAEEAITKNRSDATIIILDLEGDL